MACTGNCNQGRMCDCVPDVLPEPNPNVDEWLPCTWQESLKFWLTTGAACAGALGLLWWRLS